MKYKHTTSLLLSVVLSTSVMADIKQHSPRSNSIYKYQIGGSGFSSRPPATQIETVTPLEMGAAWDLGNECGEFDPSISIGNQLNGITDGFKDMMGSIMAAATSAIASLPALALQRADPGLYDLLQQGILQGKIDFEYAKLSCEDAANIVMGNDNFPFENYKMGIKTTNWSKEISASGGDGVAAKQKMDDINVGDQGAEWTCGNLRAGTGQRPINTLFDVVVVGYNTLYDVANKCDESSSGLSATDTSAVKSYWSNAGEAARWLVGVTGDTQIRLCTGCKKQTGEPGVGLAAEYIKEKELVKVRIEALINGTTVMSWQELNRVSAPPSLIVDQALIDAIKYKTDVSQDILIRKLAGEIVATRLFEQVRLQTQLLMTGAIEPNVSANKNAIDIIEVTIADMDRQLGAIQREGQVQKTAGSETLIRILGFEEQSILEAPESRGGSTSGSFDSIGRPK